MDNREPCVLYEGGGRVAFLTLNRPEKRNALSADLLEDFNRALDAFDSDPEPHVAILRANGPSFCAGFDLSRDSGSVQPIGHDSWGDRTRLRRWLDLVIRIWECPRPIIAQVHGHCLAGGVLLPMACDVVFISDTCAVGWPRLPIGAGLMDGAMALLVGQRRAKQISYVIGSRITGREAAEWGYANVAVAAAALERETLTFARRVARTPRTILEIRKAAINRASSGLSFRDALLEGVEWDVIAHLDADVIAMKERIRQKGVKAVIEAFESGDDEATGLDGTRSASPTASSGESGEGSPSGTKRR
jgi:enoyl-CoA hydratase